MRRTFGAAFIRCVCVVNDCILPLVSLFVFVSFLCTSLTRVVSVFVGPASASVILFLAFCLCLCVSVSVSVILSFCHSVILIFCLCVSVSLCLPSPSLCVFAESTDTDTDTDTHTHTMAVSSVKSAAAVAAAATVAAVVALQLVSAAFPGRAAARDYSCIGLAGRFMTKPQRRWWLDNNCERQLTPTLEELQSPARRRRKLDTRQQQPGDTPVIGIGVATTTRGLVRPPDDSWWTTVTGAAPRSRPYPGSPMMGAAAAPGPLLPTSNEMTVDALPLAALLRSVVATAESGFEYRVYVVYDEGDPFLDVRLRDDGQETLGVARDGTLDAWFDTTVAVPLATRGVSATLTLVRFKNRLHKPGPAMNVAMHAAYDDGADFLYRVNDDTVMTTPWASAMVAALRTAQPPLLGVVGPLCEQGNTHILTHDFTHRTHLDIFASYYPPALTGWYLDDWITRVYGGMNTRRSRVVASAVVEHRADPVKRRYVVAPHLKRLLDTEVVMGVEAVLQFLQSRTDVRPVDPTTHRALNVQMTPLHNTRYPHGVYAPDGTELVPPLPATAPAHKLDDHPASPARRVLRRVDDAGAHPAAAPADPGVQPHDQPWVAAMEDFFVVRRLAKARRSLCAVSGC